MKSINDMTKEEWDALTPIQRREAMGLPIEEVNNKTEEIEETEPPEEAPPVEPSKEPAKAKKHLRPHALMIMVDYASMTHMTSQLGSEAGGYAMLVWIMLQKEVFANRRSKDPVKRELAEHGAIRLPHACFTKDTGIGQKTLIKTMKLLAYLGYIKVAKYTPPNQGNDMNEYTILKGSYTHTPT